MLITRLDHYSIRSTDVTACAAFYQQTLALVPGPRPNFPFPGAWLYRADAQGESSGNALVHLVGVGAEDGNGLADYLGAKADRPQDGTGALDHIAFHAVDLPGMYHRLAANGIAFRERRVPGMALHQLFLQDPCGVTLELNYDAPADLAAADARAQRP